MIGSYSEHAQALTPRMRDVGRCGVRGLGVKGTALELGTSESTVRTLRAAFCARLGKPTFLAAVVEADRRGEL